MKINDLRVGAVAAVLAVSVSAAGTAAAVGAEATTAKATIAKKKCKKAKARSAKKKCHGSPTGLGGNYAMLTSEGGTSFGSFRFAAAGLFPNPTPVILSPELDSDFLNCRTTSGLLLHSKVETAGHTYPDLKAGTFSFSFPPAGSPDTVRGQIRMEGHWVTPRKIVGSFEAHGVGYHTPPDPESPPSEGDNWDCTDVSTPFVAIGNAPG
jgi:hypothetical protein